MLNKEIEKKIYEEYLRQDARLGWSFLYGPQATLETANTVFLGLNPGGNIDCGQSFSSEEGSAYVKQIWEQKWGKGKAPLQLQAQTLFKILGVEPDHVLSGNLYPIRTPSWDDIKDKKTAIAFSKELWKPILTKRPFRVITMGGDTEDAIVDILDASKSGEPIPTGWGKINARFYKYSRGIICALPHLSRYQIFNRQKTDQLEKAIALM